MLTRHYESAGTVHAPPDELFAHLDDHARLSGHMEKSSWMMAGARMRLELDEGAGRRVGSRLTLSGRVLGVRLWVEEVVTDREPPRRKAWETVGAPRLLVIGDYRMGFELAPRDAAASEIRVFIDYALPATGVARWLGRLMGDWYARWCTRRMVDDAVRHFARGGGRSAPQPAGRLAHGPVGG
jgi:hypothetical protein